MPLYALPSFPRTRLKETNNTTRTINSFSVKTKKKRQQLNTSRWRFNETTLKYILTSNTNLSSFPKFALHNQIDRIKKVVLKNGGEYKRRKKDLRFFFFFPSLSLLAPSFLPSFLPSNTTDPTDRPQKLKIIIHVLFSVVKY